jgi:hypothetical protein
MLPNRGTVDQGFAEGAQPKDSEEQHKQVKRLDLLDYGMELSRCFLEVGTKEES